MKKVRALVVRLQSSIPENFYMLESPSVLVRLGDEEIALGMCEFAGLEQVRFHGEQFYQATFIPLAA